MQTPLGTPMKTYHNEHRVFGMVWYGMVDYPSRARLEVYLCAKMSPAESFLRILKRTVRCPTSVLLIEKG